MSRLTDPLKFEWANPNSYEPPSNPYTPDNLIGADPNVLIFDDLPQPLHPPDPPRSWGPQDSIPHLNSRPPKAPIEAPPPDRPPTWPSGPTPSQIARAGADGEVNDIAPQRMVQNLTAHVLRMKGVPEAVIGAAMNDPAQMQGLLNQLYGRRPMVASDAGGGFGGQIGAEIPDGQHGPAPTPSTATPDTYLPFGWAGLPALQR